MTDIAIHDVDEQVLRANQALKAFVAEHGHYPHGKERKEMEQQVIKSLVADGLAVDPEDQSQKELLELVTLSSQVLRLRLQLDNS